MIDLDAVQRDIEGCGGKILRVQSIDFHGGRERYFQVLDGDQVISFTVRENDWPSLNSAMVITPTARNIIEVLKKHMKTLTVAP